MIDKNILVRGKYYFLIYYHDSKNEIPIIKTYIYIGQNLISEESFMENEWFFKDVKSYLEHGDSLDLPGVKHEIFVATEDVLSRMYDIDGLIEKLTAIRMRRN